MTKEKKKKNTEDLKKKYQHRDLSWLQFNERVLEEAKDKKNPLLERSKFLSIFVSNLDEFFMVRVAGILNLMESKFGRRDRYGYYPQEIFAEINQRVLKLKNELYTIAEHEILPELENENIFLKKIDGLNDVQKQFIEKYFHDVLYPIITPMAVDQSHPFPVMPSRSIAFAVLLNKKDEEVLAILPVPNNVPRLLALPSKQGVYEFIPIEDVIRHYLHSFFKGVPILKSCLFRLIRDSDLAIDEEFAPNLLKAIEDNVRKRRSAPVVFLESEAGSDDDLLNTICERIDFPFEQVIKIGQRIDLMFFFELLKNIDRPDLKDPTLDQGKVIYEDIFERIKEEDLMIHMPFQSFQPTIDLIQAAAKDKDVLAIKMTLYRTNKDSSIISALKEAAINKKQVTVLVEIRARFDEENNIKWVRELEEAGCHVAYGIPGLKVHSKMTLIVRQEQDRIRRYVHLSTGNYNEQTAKIYTDIGYFTANDDIAKDISDIFNVITGYSEPSRTKRIISSPKDLRPYLMNLIDREIENQNNFNNGYIFAKFNSLEDTEIIDQFYKASQAGVKIQLIVRGICCLIPGQKGLSENIEVRSVVGRFLEHTRIYYFFNNRNPRVFISSSDLMNRNLSRRIEIMFEITNQSIFKKLKDLLDRYWKDNCKTRKMLPSKKYKYLTSTSKSYNIQDKLMQKYQSDS